MKTTKQIDKVWRMTAKKRARVVCLVQQCAVHKGFFFNNSCQQDRYTSVNHLRDRNLTEAQQHDTLWDRMEGPQVNKLCETM